MGNTVPERAYTDAISAQMGERVTNLSRRQSDLESEMRSGFRQIESSMTSMSSEMRSSVAALSTSFQERNKPQWPVLIGFGTFAITILGGLGYLALQPIKDNQAQLREDARIEAASTKESLSTIVTSMVTQQELKWRTDRGLEDRKRTDDMVSDIRTAQVPRAELERVWHSEDLVNAQMQKQIDELKATAASTYSARDIILELRERLDRVERERLKAPG